MRWIDILDDVPYWEFCLICNKLVTDNSLMDVPLGHETVHDNNG